MSFLKPDETFSIIKDYTGRIDDFKYCFEISIEEYNSIFYKKVNNNGFSDYSIDKDYLIDLFFGGIKNFIKIYKENNSEELSYYTEKINDRDFYEVLSIHTDTNELTRTKRISFILESLYFGFTDPELDRAGDIETLLKQRKLQNNLKGF